MLIDKASTVFFSVKHTNVGQKIILTTDTTQVHFSVQSKWNQICRISVAPFSNTHNLTSSKANYLYKGNGLTRKTVLL